MMKTDKHPRGHLAATSRASRCSLRLALAMCASGLGLYGAPGHADAPLDCNMGYGYVDVTDARYVASGADCYTVKLTIHSTGALSNAGTLVSYLDLYNKTGGQVMNAVSGSMLLYGSFVNAGGLDNFGGLTVYGNGVNSGGLRNFGTILSAAGFTNSGYFVNQGGTFQSAGPLMNHGSLMNGPGSLLVSHGIISNLGTITNMSGAQILNNNSFINSGTLTNLGGRVDNFDSLTNLGTVTNQLGTVVNFGTLKNLSTLRNGVNGKLENFGTVSNLGFLFNQMLGTLTNYVTLSNQRVLRNEAGAVLVNHGRLSNAVGATVENGGTLTNAPGGEFRNQGTLTNDSGGMLANQDTLTNEGPLGVFTNRGSVANTPGGKLVNKATFNNEAGARFVNAGTLQNDGAINNAGTLVSTGRVYGSGSYVQTSGSTAIVGGYPSTFSQDEITIKGGQLIGDGRISSSHVVAIGADALLAPGSEPGDIGMLRISAPIDLFGSLDIDIDGPGHLDYVTVGDSFAGDAVTFSPDGSSWFNFYLDDDASQGSGDTFTFFHASGFLNFDALNFRCYGLMGGLGCALNMIDGGRRLQLALFDGSGGGAEGVPEPGSFGMLCLGLVLAGGLACCRRRGVQGRNATA